MRGSPGRSLFWRTFALIALLVAVSLGIWIQLSHLLQQHRLARVGAAQLVAVATVARTTLALADPAQRQAVVTRIDSHRDIDLFPRHPGDRTGPMRSPIAAVDLRRRVEAGLGTPIEVFGSVNGQRGVWISFDLGGSPYWLRVHGLQTAGDDGGVLLLEAALAALLSLVGAAVITHLLNRPLRDLVIATARVREGDYSHELDEDAGTAELRAVNRGFNRMARALHDMEQDRALMLAGISHDIRTPLARLRLEAELSVADLRARRDMANDIEQADSIISKLMEYASTAVPAREAVIFGELLGKVGSDYAKAADLRLTVSGDTDLIILGDGLEMQRIVVNLVENARRYGRRQGDAMAEVEISCARRTHEAMISVRDHGPGVPPEQLALLTRPFYRGDPARTPGKGTGLGLAIVERTLARMGGRLVITNAREGGLLVRVWMPRHPLDTLPPNQL